MKKSMLFAVAALLVSGSAQALTLTAQPGSTFGLGISAGVLGSGSNSGAVAGSLTAGISLNNPVDQNSGVNIAPGAAGSFTVADFQITGLSLGLLEIKGFGLSVSNPAGAAVAGPNPYTVDLGGSTISVTSGLVILGGSTLFDFSSAPINVVAPAGTNTTLDAGLAATNWTIPFTTLSTLSTFGIPVNITISTNLLLSGDSIVVPEPGTVLLIGAGLAGLALAGRRKAA